MQNIWQLWIAKNPIWKPLLDDGCPSIKLKRPELQAFCVQNLTLPLANAIQPFFLGWDFWLISPCTSIKLHHRVSNPNCFFVRARVIIHCCRFHFVLSSLGQISALTILWCPALAFLAGIIKQPILYYYLSDVVIADADVYPFHFNSASCPSSVLQHKNQNCALPCAAPLNTDPCKILAKIGSRVRKCIMTS